MTFTKATVLGFVTGFSAAVVVSRIRAPRPGFLISADKKETTALLNDVLEDREMLFALTLSPEKDHAGLIELIRVKAAFDPRWNRLLRMYENIGDI